MFVKAGRMGNMASDIQPDGKEQGKKVCSLPSDFVHLSKSNG